jgi:hypothetical protein
MSQKFAYKADVNEEGKIEKIHNKRAFDVELQQFKGKSIRIEISKWTKKRTLPQLRYYRGSLLLQVIDALVENGYPRHELNPDVVHLMLKQKFLKKTIVSEETGDCIEIIGSTKDLTTVGMMEYIDDIVRYCAEMLNYQVILPNEQAMMNI